MKNKTVLLIALSTISIMSCTLMPGSDQSKIRLAVTNYLEGKLNAGETMQGGILRENFLVMLTVVNVSAPR